MENAKNDVVLIAGIEDSFVWRDMSRGAAEPFWVFIATTRESPRA
jgi:hypothetical protein